MRSVITSSTGITTASRVLLVIAIGLLDTCNASPRFHRAGLVPRSPVNQDRAAVATGSAGQNSTVSSNGTTTGAPDAVDTASVTRGASITITPAPSTSVGTAGCKPSSICVDYFTCAQRFGGCYDKNFCGGITTSFSLPSCGDEATAVVIATQPATVER